jgi:hypothetical protein
VDFDKISPVINKEEREESPKRISSFPHLPSLVKRSRMERILKVYEQFLETHEILCKQLGRVNTNHD